MILEFSVSNFLSFKDKVTLSMEANASKGLDNNYVLLNDKKVLKTLALYGANASGKSNLLIALNTLITMLKNSDIMNINTELPIVPFKFDKKNISKPSEFEIKFIIDNVRYVYGVIADKNKIYDEYLYYYPNGRETKIFDRTNTNDYSFSQKEEKKLKDISMKNTDNKFFLSTATSWNYEKTKNVYNFLTNDIMVIDNINNLKDKALKEYLYNKNLKEFALDFLKEADFNITDYEIYETDIPKGIFSSFPGVVMDNAPYNIKTYNVLFKHDNNTLTFEEESKGTQIVFSFIPFIKDAINNHKIIVIDELDKSMHPYLIELIINMFNNSDKSQLIFNTHDTNLLDLNLLRRDQIWFTEKDSSTGISDLYSLSDFAVRKSENVEKGYMLGRYGAVPFIKNDINLWEE